MIGKVFITRTGYDPQLGKHVKDPYLGECPTLGACRPDIREQVTKGDHLFFISGKVPDTNQFIMGGFEVAEKISAMEAYERFPDLRLRKRDDGQLTGNIIVNAHGIQHRLDDHSSFERRIQNYVVGRNLLSLTTIEEIAEGRDQTLDMLQEILGCVGPTAISMVHRSGKRMTARQVHAMRSWLTSIKQNCSNN